MSKNEHGGVWPKRQRAKLNLQRASSKEVEDLISSKFNGGFPVVLSSGRGAMKLIVQEFWTKKEIAIFQFASQCVVTSIQAASVTPYSRIDFTSDIVYHQWGYSDRRGITPPFIEDSCDTFLEEGSSVLRLDGQFEIWSLPKILNSRFGAIAWCQNDLDARHLRAVRDKSKKFPLWKKQFYRSLKGVHPYIYKIWENSEYRTFQLSKSEYGMIKKDISEWKEKYRERFKLAYKAYSFLNDRYQDCFETPLRFVTSEQPHVAPVVILIDSQQPQKDFSEDNSFEVLHRVVRGEKPEKKMIYKFLKDKRLNVG